MTRLFISEFARQARDAAGYVVQGTPEYPATAEQVLTIGASSAQSATLHPATTIIELVADTACSIAVTVDPVATAVNRRIPANVPIQIGVPVNSGFRIAVIANT